MKDKIIDKALELTDPHERRYYNELDNVHWVEKDYCSCDYDYCSDCIDEALHNERKAYLLEQRKLPVAKRDKNFAVFRSTNNYGGGYESDYFNTCELCGKSLDISILPNEQVLEEALEDLESGKIDDHLGWKINSLLYNAWGEDRGKEKCSELTLQLAKRVIEILEATSAKKKASV